MNKIYLVGDSILRGIVYDSERGKYRFGEEMKLHCLEDKGYGVVNLSRMGATVDKGYALLERKLTGDLSGDTVILGFGGNDCNYNWQRVSDKNCDGILPCTPMDTFEQTYRKCIAYAKGLGARVMSVTLVPLDGKKYMNWISRGLSRENILDWLGDESMLYRWQESYNQKVWEISEDTGCDRIDIRHPFLFSHDYSSLMCEDGIHPTEKGYSLIKSSISDKITN